MAVPTGTSTTYDLLAGVKVSIDELIRLLDPVDAPLQGGVGSDGRTVFAHDIATQKKEEWQDETILIPVSTCVEALDAVETGVDVTTGDGVKFGIGSVILIEDEQMRVTAVATDTLTVTRGWNSTTAATHAINSVVLDLGISLAEGSDPEAARASDWTNRFNYCQIFGPNAVQISGTEQAIAKYGLRTTQFDKQAMDRMAEDKVRLEHALLYGKRKDGAGDNIRQMGGMTHYITTNVNATATAPTSTLLLDQIQACWDLGGRPDRAATGSKQKRVISGFDSADIRLGRTDVGRGQTVEYFDTDFGRVDFVLHRRIRVSDLFLFSREQATIKTLRPWQFQMLGLTGDSIKGQIVSEKTLKWEAERWSARFSALT